MTQLIWKYICIDVDLHLLKNVCVAKPSISEINAKRHHMPYYSDRLEFSLCCSAKQISSMNCTLSCIHVKLTFMLHCALVTSRRPFRCTAPIRKIRLLRQEIMHENMPQHCCVLYSSLLSRLQ